MSQQSKKRIPPFSLRLSEEERARLERDAGDTPLGAYIKSRLFASVSKKKTREELAKILSELGRMNIAENLNHLARAVKTSSLIVSPETEKAIAGCCLDIKWIRYVLIKALGLVPKNDYDS